MSDHLPECPQNHPGDINGAVCACPALRACEARVSAERDEFWEEWSNEVADLMPEQYDGDEAQESIILRFVAEAADQRRKGYAEALDAARDAVAAAYSDDHTDDWGVQVVYKERMLAAIDALRGTP